MAVNNNVGLYTQLFQETPYVFVNTRNMNGRIVEKYCFNNELDPAATRAAQAVRTLLEIHRNLKPTFATNGDVLAQEIARYIYLTINGNAVSLSAERAAPDGAPRESIDRYFSESFIREPTQCPQGHWFELSRARIWAENMQNLCPAGDPHLIGNLTIDDDAQDFIQGFERNRNQQQQIQRDFVDRQQVLIIGNANLDIQQQRQRRDINILGDRVTNNHWSTVGVVGVTSGKVVMKIAITKGGAKIFTKIVKMAATKFAIEGGAVTGKSFAKGVVKKLPVISFFIGCATACYRAYNGQWIRAGGEVVSGLAACVPGYGTAAAVSLDLLMAGYDGYEICYPSDVEAPAEIQIDLNMAYQVIGIDIVIDNNPTREQVDHAYRNQSMLLHPDRAGELGEYNQEQLEAMMQALNTCRDQIYRIRGW